jgi:hypothetical protein
MVTEQPQLEARPALLGGPRLGSLIGAIFGLVYLEVNAGRLPAPGPALVRLAGAAAFAGLVIALLATRQPQHAGGGHLQPEDGADAGFRRGFWLIVAGEGVAIVAGSAMLTGPLGLPERGVVAWVSVVVGVHFLALGAIWRTRLFHVLGAAIAASGIAGLVAASEAASDAMVGIFGAILPGALLLAAAYWGVLHPAPTRRPAPTKERLTSSVSIPPN